MPSEEELARAKYREMLEKWKQYEREQLDKNGENMAEVARQQKEARQLR